VLEEKQKNAALRTSFNSVDSKPLLVGLN